MSEPPAGDALSPEDIEKATFSIVENGYDRDEVEVFLHATADDMRGLLRHTSQRPYESLGQEMGALLQHAHDAAATVRKAADTEAGRVLQEAHQASKRAETEAAQLKGRAEAEASMIREEALEEAERIKREATKIHHLAEAEASLKRQDLDREARRVKEEIRREAADIRAAAEGDARTRLRESERRLRQLQEAEITMRKRIGQLTDQMRGVEQATASSGAGAEPPAQS